MQSDPGRAAEKVVGRPPAAGTLYPPSALSLSQLEVQLKSQVVLGPRCYVKWHTDDSLNVQVKG